MIPFRYFCILSLTISILIITMAVQVEPGQYHGDQRGYQRPLSYRGPHIRSSKRGQEKSVTRTRVSSSDIEINIRNPLNQQQPDIKSHTGNTQQPLDLQKIIRPSIYLIPDHPVDDYEELHPYYPTEDYSSVGYFHPQATKPVYFGLVDHFFTVCAFFLYILSGNSDFLDCLPIFLPFIPPTYLISMNDILKQSYGVSLNNSLLNTKTNPSQQFLHHSYEGLDDDGDHLEQDHPTSTKINSNIITHRSNPLSSPCLSNTSSYEMKKRRVEELSFICLNSPSASTFSNCLDLPNLPIMTSSLPNIQNSF